MKPTSNDQKSEKYTVAEIEAQVLANDTVNREYKHLLVRAGVPATNAQPGQFFNLACPSTGQDNPFLKRPMSLYGVNPRQREIEFLYKVKGAGTRGMANLQTGDTFKILGPLGIGFQLDRDWKHIVLVGRGVGLATLAPLAKLARQNGIGVTAIISARNPDMLMSLDRFQSQAAKVYTLTDAQGNSGMDVVERLLSDLIEAQKADALFTCGSQRLMKLLQHMGNKHDIPGQIALEQHMACGLGMCYGCVRDFRVEGGVVQRCVCSDGPVFNLKEALRW